TPPAPHRRADAVVPREREARARDRLSVVGRQPRSRAAALRAMAAVVVPQFKYVGRPIGRLEDRPLLTGHGRFVADLDIAGTLAAAFVRSPHAHALIRGIDADAARRHPGVRAVLTLRDLAPLLSDERLPLQFRTAQLPADITPFVLAKDEVSFVS